MNGGEGGCDGKCGDVIRTPRKGERPEEKGRKEVREAGYDGKMEFGRVFNIREVMKKKRMLL